MKAVDKRIDESVLWWFGYGERMKNDRIVKRVYVGEYAGRLWKKWINTVEDCL